MPGHSRAVLTPAAIKSGGGNLLTDSQQLVTIENIGQSLRGATEVSNPRERDVAWLIAQSTAIDKAVLSRFMNGKSGLSVASIDQLCTVLGFRLVSVTELSKQRKRRK